MFIFKVLGAVAKLGGKIVDAFDSVVDFGGLLGTAPIMELKPYSPARFIHRGGRIPAPIHSLKN